MSLIENYRSANNIGSDDTTHLSESNITGLITDLSNKLSKSGDTLQGNLNCINTYRLTNVPTPSSSADVANKSYVDSVVGNGGSTINDTITTINNTLATKLTKSGDTLSGNISCANTYKLTYVPNPSASTDVANKSYVDTATSSISSTVSSLSSSMSTKLNKTGDILQGDINCNSLFRLYNVPNPGSNYDIANKIYVDTATSGISSTVTSLSSTVSNKLSKSGDTLTGNINCNSLYKLTNVPNPTTSTDVANKAYVDSVVSTGGSGTSFTGIITNNTSPQLALQRTTDGEDSIKFYNSVVSAANYRLGTGISNSGDFSLYSEALSSNVYCCNSLSRFAIGLSSPDSATQLYINNKSNSSYIMQLACASTTSCTTAIGTPGLYLTQTSSSGDIIACDMTPTLGVFSGLTSSYVACYRASPAANSSPSGTITSLIGYYYDGGNLVIILILIWL